jgi:tetratricopeptide (TPR) repeat protein
MIIHTAAVAAALSFVVPAALTPTTAVSDYEICIGGYGAEAATACERAMSDERVRVRDLADNLVNRGQLHYAKREFDLAIADFNMAIRFDPAFALAFGNRANAWSMKKDFKRAVADYTRAIQLDKDFPSAYTGRGLVLEELGDIAGARRDYQAAIAAPSKYQDSGWAQRVARERIAGFDKKLGPTADATNVAAGKK